MNVIVRFIFNFLQGEKSKCKKKNENSSADSMNHGIHMEHTSNAISMKKNRTKISAVVDSTESKRRKWACKRNIVEQIR